MPDFDLIVRDAIVVTEHAIEPLEIGISGEKIVALAPSIAGSARAEIIATGLHVFCGIIDAHVHFNEPGRTDWEGIETGSQALAAGGGTLFFDMPLNAHPPTTDAQSFDLKLAAARQHSLTDFALWGGLVPGNVNQLDELGARGVIGFKAFMSNSGIDDFQNVDDKTLREGMKRAVGLNLPVAVHAESETLTSKLSRQKFAHGRTSVRDYLESRPIAAEVEAIQRAIDIAAETGCALHIVHVSSAEGVSLVAAAKRKNINVSCETCPHYLTITGDDVERIGALAKCAPPMRSAEEQEKLWQRLKAGEIDTIGSDHSPSPPGLKAQADFFEVWGGISGVQHTLPLLLTANQTDGHTISLSRLSRLLSRNAAERFGLPRTKGRFEMGADADLAMVKLDAEFEVDPEQLFYRHKQSPYSGRKLRGRVVRTLLRGNTLFQDGKIVAKPGGRLVKPAQ